MREKYGFADLFIAASLGGTDREGALRSDRIRAELFRKELAFGVEPIRWSRLAKRRSMGRPPGLRRDRRGPTSRSSLRNLPAKLSG
jgi:hypothetical protein